ncbi:MAG: cytochrome d ubiquinol oxidase subunit II, partial [Actinobacteria bacterium]|nr:cytochrome d ubiquinol oxidase subunit II [Actinomycetota bacterium]
FFLGTVAGAVASGRVPPGNAEGDPIGSWLNPTSVLAGLFAIAVCAYLAAVYLTGDAERAGETELVEYFRRRALATGMVTGIVSAAGILVLRSDAPALFEGLLGRGLPMLPLSVLGGAATIWFVFKRRHLYARVAAAVAVVGVLGGWAAGQYPNILVGMTIQQAAAAPVTLRLVMITLTIGGLFFIPGLIWMLVLFHGSKEAAAPRGKGMV